MKIEYIEREIPARKVTDKVYIAFDGTRFNEEETCKSYEERFKLKDKIKVLRLCYDEYPYALDTNEEFDYEYYKLNSEEDLKLLEQVYNLDSDTYDIFDFPTIVCVESNYNCSESWLYTFADELNSIKKHIEAFGYTVVKSQEG